MEVVRPTTMVRNLVFTAWGEGEEGSEDFFMPLLFPMFWPDCTYCIYQLERCPETSRLHYQGYAEFTGQKRFAWLHKHCEGLEDAHFEIRRGSQLEGINYASKKETRVEGPWEWGEPKEDNQGKRNDLLKVKKKIDEGASEEYIANNFFGTWARYHRSFRLYKVVTNRVENRRWKMKIEVYVGKSGYGKSEIVDKKYPNAYWKENNKWWDNYNGQEVVIWDEFYGHSCPFTFLLRLLDSKPMTVETKGSSVSFVSKTICFTSNEIPSKWYDSEKTHQMCWVENPLCRRLRDFGECYVAVEKFKFERVDPDDFSTVLEPDFGGQDPTVPIAGMTMVEGHVPDREIPMPQWVNDPSVAPSLGIVLIDPQRKMDDFIPSKDKEEF